MKKSDNIWLAIAGILLVVLGILCICKPATTLFAAAWVIGCFTLISGIVKLVFTFKTQAFIPNSASRAISAILLIIVGLIFLCNNFFVASSLPVIFILWILIESIIITIESFDYKKIGFPYWWIILILGIVGIILGIIGLRDPSISAVALTTLIGIAIISMGAGYLVGLSAINRFEEVVKEAMKPLKKAAKKEAQKEIDEQ